MSSPQTHNNVRVTATVASAPFSDDKRAQWPCPLPERSSLTGACQIFAKDGQVLKVARATVAAFKRRNVAEMVQKASVLHTLYEMWDHTLCES